MTNRLRCETRAPRRGFSSLELSGVMSVILVVAILLLWWGQTALNQSRETACRSNLTQIGTALALYADDHAGRLPASPDAIHYVARVYAKNQQLFVCPEDPPPPPPPAPPVSSEPSSTSPPVFAPIRLPTRLPRTSYFLSPGYANDDPPASIVAGDTEARHGGYWNAVCLDGRTERLPARELPQHLPQGGDKP